MSVRGSSPSRRDSQPGDAAAGERLSLIQAMIDLARLVARSQAPGLRWRLIVALVLTFGSKLTDVLAPLFLGVAVNRLAGGRGGHGLHHAAQTDLVSTLGWSFAGLAIGWAAMRLGSAAAPQLRDIVFGPVGQAAQRKAAAETFAHALSLSLDFHQTKRTGALARTIDRGARAVDFLLRILVFNLAPTAVALVFAAGVLGKAYDWRFAATAIVTVVVYGILTFAVSDWRIAHRRVLNEADAAASARAVDALLNYETVKAFGAEARAASGYDLALATYSKASVTANNSLAILNMIQSAIMTAGLLVMTLLAGMEVAAGRMGPGDITASILILTSLYQPLNILGFAYREIRQSTIDMEAMLALRRQEPGIKDAPDAVDLPPCPNRLGGEVAFEGVSFRHSARVEGLRDVSFVAKPGQTVAIVGPSGAGKSTLVKLALRLIDPQQGAVRIDGYDARALTQASLRRAVALVPQDVALFNDTLAANIGFGRPGAGEEDVWAAAEAAELGAFIRSLPDGMDTKVGERGLKLSGGERQRVGLARALIANPRILILDEATSALDSRTEAAIQATLRRAKTGRTTLVVAHRLSTVADADQILVLKNGRLVERGAHAELVMAGGEYAALWRRQTREG